MVRSLTRFPLTAALTFASVAAVAACDSSDKRQPSAAEPGARATQVAAANPSVDYDPAITVYKNPT